jgi:hypothetical protein
MPTSSQRMGHSRSLTHPLTEQDLYEPKFSLLVEKVWSSLDYKQSMRSDMLDEELLSLMDRCGNTLKPSKGKKKARNQGKLS